MTTTILFWQTEVEIITLLPFRQKWTSQMRITRDTEKVPPSAETDTKFEY